MVIGLDAADPEVFDDLFDRGVTPTLERLVESGASGPLESQVPPWTPSAWPSLYTGVNPGKHGVFGFLDFDGYDWDVVNATDVHEWTLPEILDREGYTSVVVNAPVTHPPSTVDGAVVPGYVGPEDPDCHPSGVLEEIREATGPYRVYGIVDADAPREDLLDSYRRLVAMRGRAFRYLLSKFDPHFGFLQFQQTDHVFHERPGDEDAVRAVYRAVDEEIAAVLDACDPRYVFVVSDHGIGRYEGVDFRINAFLRDRSDVVTTRAGDGMPSWTALDRGGVEDEAPHTGGSVLSTVTATLARAGLTSQRAGAALSAVGVDGLVKRVVPADAIRAGTESVDFAASRAYARSRIELGVRLNVVGREPDGVIPPEEYDAVRRDLIEALSAVETPDGDPVFESVRPREAVFSGPYLDDAVDIVTVPAGYDNSISTGVRARQFDSGPLQPFSHKRYGFVSVSGPDVTPGDLEGAHLFDVAPSVLATFGLPASTRMDGNVLSVLDPVGTAAYPEHPTTDRTRTDERDVESRLAEMGYLEQ